jgi:hypothetical protein
MAKVKKDDERRADLVWENAVDNKRPGEILKADWDACRPPIRYVVLRLDGRYVVTRNQDGRNELLGACLSLSDARACAQDHANAIVKAAKKRAGEGR